GRSLVRRHTRGLRDLFPLLGDVGGRGLARLRRRHDRGVRRLAARERRRRRLGRRRNLALRLLVGTALGLRGLGSRLRRIRLRESDLLRLGLVGDEGAGGGTAARRTARRHAGHRARACALGLLLGRGDLVAVVDPHLHADLPERRLRLRGAEVHFRAERVEGHPSLAVPLAARHLRAAESSPALDADTERAGTRRGLDAPAHRTAERHAAGELLRDALREERGVGLRTRLARGGVHVLALDVAALLRDAFHVLADLVHLRALAADHDARPGGADEHPDLIALALDVDA